MKAACISALFCIMLAIAPASSHVSAPQEAGACKGACKCGPACGCKGCACPAKVDPVKVCAKLQRWTLHIPDRGAGIAGGKFGFTAAHLFTPGQKWTPVETSTGVKLTARIWRIDFAEDLCILKFPEGIEIAGPDWLRPMCSAEVGTPLYVVGSPYGRLTYTVTSGIVSAKDRNDDSRWKCLDQTDAGAWGGNSGGGVYTHDGKLCGILVAGWPTPVHNLYIPTRTVWEWISKVNAECNPMCPLFKPMPGC